MFFVLLALFCVACICMLVGWWLSVRGQTVDHMEDQREREATRRYQREPRFTSYRDMDGRRIYTRQAAHAREQYSMQETRPIYRTEEQQRQRRRDGYGTQDQIKRTGQGRVQLNIGTTPLLGVVLILISLFLFGLYYLHQALPGNNMVVAAVWPDAAAAAAQPLTKTSATQTKQLFSGTVGASAALKRVYQLDPAQYDSMQQYNTWAYSTCSTAAMTEVINAYGHHYRLADVLNVESGIHEITPDLGLLEPVGIERTVARFGFQTYWPAHATLDDVINIANSGRPVIVGFPPALWSGGHLLVVTGGNSTTVFIADSSRLNIQAFTRTNFLKYWVGFAAVVTPMSQSAASITVGPTPTVMPSLTPLATHRVNVPQRVHRLKNVIRISQQDESQYASPQQYQLWEYSDSSAAVMTEVINTYGHHYRIADTLTAEIDLHVITPEQGLLVAAGISETAAHFGFQAQFLENSSVNDLLKLANSGVPVIVAFPPDRWSGGHFLVVTGGDSEHVLLVDSSEQNVQSLLMPAFQKYWAGFAVVLSPAKV